MEETRDRAYLQLIHTLLNCPNGEEPQILEDNIELLDREFLKTCESIAETLAQQGGENGANFLRNLVTQLEELIEEKEPKSEISPEYANFFLELLQAEQDGDPQVIYSTIERQKHLLNASFADTLQQVAQKLIVGENPQTISSIVALIENLSNHLSQFLGGDRASNIEIAISGYQIVLNNREPGSEKFAQTQNNLAASYCERINGSRADNLQRAIEFYQAALTVYTLEDFPEQWAMTQNNLAIASSYRINS
ncbi:MAG: tetratricopeptide repeat protein [Oscillatoriales cyanobacterium RU_3_3]|nr:tetratricopeptide repeat protein [Oscillatoriales cyanobacterium RU_3_3]NJR21754.1 tetratricopeptide repeat protein [Richelia sp. CSU_2_1]